MKLLPFQITEQERQALKEAGRGGRFKLFQREILVYIILLVLAVTLLWRHYIVLTFVITVLAGIIMARYGASLGENQATLSVANKVEAELKKQQENALKFRPKVFLFVVLPLLLLLVGVVVYILYSANQEREKMIYELDAINQEERDVVKDETADWSTYRDEEYGFETKYPNEWTITKEWWGSAVKNLVFDFKSPKGDREIYVQIETSMFEELWRGSYDIITEKEVVIGGVVGSKIVGVFKPTNKQEIFALVKKGENLYHIHFPYFYQNEEFLEQMLSTFKFLE